MAAQTTRVMIVDRSHLLREMVSRLLSDSIEKIEITACRSGGEALERLEHGRYHLITTSLMLGDMDGLDLCRRVRKSKANRFTPVVVISGDAASSSIKAGFDAGVTDYFDKSRGYRAFAHFIEEFVRSNMGLVGRVLYLEDSASVAAVVQGFLEKQGLQVTHLISAEEAYARLRAIREGGSAGEGFDLVVTDFFLEHEMTGGDLLHAIRTRLHFDRQELPVLVMTGNEDDGTQAEVLHAGANDFVSKPVVEEVLIARVRSLLLIKQQYDALRRQAERLTILATTDLLTGVSNRTCLAEKGEPFLFDPANQPVWVALFDLDYFKRINDTHGHAVGDRVLAALGTLLRELLPNALVARYGGEEFAVLLPQADCATAMQCLEGLRRAAEELEPAQVPITISIGAVSREHYPKSNLEQLLKVADDALYVSKSEGRNCTSIGTPAGFRTPGEVLADYLEATGIVPVPDAVPR